MKWTGKYIVYLKIRQNTCDCIFVLPRHVISTSIKRLITRDQHFQFKFQLYHIPIFVMPDLKMAMAIMAIRAILTHYGHMAMAIFKSDMTMTGIPLKCVKKLIQW